MNIQNPNETMTTNQDVIVKQHQTPSMTIDPTNIRPGFDEMITEMMEKMAEGLDYLATR